MRELYIERRNLLSYTLSKDIANHIYMRQLQGIIVVVASRPKILASSVSKQWRAVILRVQRERASTLNADRIRELNRQLSHIQHLQMRARQPSPNETSNVYFITLEQALQEPPSCHTLYVTCKASDEDLRSVTKGMQQKSLLVLY